MRETKYFIFSYEENYCSVIVNRANHIHEKNKHENITLTLIFSEFFPGENLNIIKAQTKEMKPLQSKQIACSTTLPKYNTAL